MRSSGRVGADIKRACPTFSRQRAAVSATSGYLTCVRDALEILSHELKPGAEMRDFWEASMPESIKIWCNSCQKGHKFKLLSQPKALQKIFTFWLIATTNLHVFIGILLINQPKVAHIREIRCNFLVRFIKYNLETVVCICIQLPFLW